ncbi:hypothetical protein ACJMK2_008136, partial [Sinanodonta woodiana]
MTTAATSGIGNSVHSSWDQEHFTDVLSYRTKASDPYLGRSFTGTSIDLYRPGEESGSESSF